MNFFETLDPLLKTFWFIALPTSLIFAVQTVMTFAGVDSHDGLSADFNADLHGGDAPFQLFSFRNLINFLLGLGWTGISFYQLIGNKVLLVALAVVVGGLFVVVFFLIIRQIERLSENNSFQIANALNKTGSVYLTIPGERKGMGKVQVSVNGSFHELDAITDNEKLESSAPVRIVSIESNNLVVVERI